MISYRPRDIQDSCDENNYTVASTFQKANTLKFQLLFGEWDRSERRDDNGDVINAVDYYFSPHKIFGFACHASGDGYRRFHGAFVLRACVPSEIGNIVTGIVPGADVLVRTSTSIAAAKLMSLLKELRKNNVEPHEISVQRYRKLNYLLEEKISTDFFVGELIGEKNFY